MDDPAAPDVEVKHDVWEGVVRATAVIPGQKWGGEGKLSVSEGGITQFEVPWKGKIKRKLDNG